MVKIVHYRIDYNKCVGLLNAMMSVNVDVFDAEEVTGGQRVFVARSEAMLYIVPQLRKS